MRARTFRSLMQRLALAATFALALVPTLGRLAQAADAPAMRDAWGAMCTVAGLTLDGATQGTHAPAVPAPHHADSGDCPYCPWSSALVAPATPAFAAVHSIPHAHASPSIDAPARFRHPTGLGSRGPPSVS